MEKKYVVLLCGLFFIFGALAFNYAYEETPTQTFTNGFSVITMQGYTSEYLIWAELPQEAVDFLLTYEDIVGVDVGENKTIVTFLVEDWDINNLDPEMVWAITAMDDRFSYNARAHINIPNYEVPKCELEQSTDTMLGLYWGKGGASLVNSDPKCL